MKRSSIKKFIPPYLLDLLRRPSLYGYFGNYKSWQEAVDASTGYDDPAILEKVKTAMLKVKNGQAASERDSILYDRVEYSWPVLSGLLWAASLNNNRLSVLDFGGSLGSSYFQNKSMLDHINLNWAIVEQPAFVQCGRKYFEDSQLTFIEDDGIKTLKLDENSVFLASSSLQYIQKPYQLIEEVISMNFPCIIIDRTAFLPDNERLTIQKTRPDIYESSYPAWFLNEKKFRELFMGKYDLISDFESIGARKITISQPEGANGYLKGFIFRRKLK